MVTEPSKEEFAEWQSSKVTQFIKFVLTEQIDDLKEALAEGKTVGNELEHARLVGNIQGLKFLFNVEYED